MAPVSLRSPEELGHMWENFLIAERIKRNDYAGRTFVQHYFWRTQQKKEVDLIEIEDGMMTGFEIKRKEGKRVGAPASFTAAYPDAHFECVTPKDLVKKLLLSGEILNIYTHVNKKKKSEAVSKINVLFSRKTEQN